ncbi:MAG: IPT/TIG domain-containing protein [Bryobacteraceae bacterium]
MGLLVFAGAAARLPAQNSTLSVNPTQFIFNAQNGAAPSQTLNVSSTSGSQTITTSVFSSGWLSVSAASGTTPLALTLSANAGGLDIGTYGGFVTVGNANGIITVPVTLNVISTGPGPGSSALSAVPASLIFNLPAGATLPVNQQLSVLNSGASSLTVSAVATTGNGGNWLSVNPSSVSIVPSGNSSLNVSVTPSGLASGVYNAVIALSPPGTNGITVPVTVNIGTSQGLSVAPSQLSFAYQTGTVNPAQQNLVITTGGTSPINFTAAANTSSCGSNWLILTQQSASTPATIGVQINPVGLQPGNCMGQIQLSAPGSSTPSVTIPVNLLVSNNPLILVPSTGANFMFQTGGGTPTAQSVQITSSSTPLPFTAAATPITGGVNFLSVSPATGTTPQALSLSLNSAVVSGLAPGTYMENVTITAPGSGNTPQTFPVTLVVSNVPLLKPSQSTVNFNFQIGQASPQSQILTLTSTGVPLNYAVAASSTNCSGFLSASPTTGLTPAQPGQLAQVVISVNTTGITTPTSCNGTVTLTVPGSTNTPVTIPVTLTASTTPLLNISQGAINVIAVAGSTTPVQQSISLTSTDGTTALNFSAAATTNPAGLTWLSVTPNTGSTPNNLNLTINPTGLAAGVYQGTIALSSTSANVPAQMIPVTLTVASASVTAAPVSLSFVQALNGSAPASQSIQLTGVPAGATVGATATVLNGTGWLTATSGTGGTITVAANGAGLSQGVYQGVVTVLVPGTTPSPVYVPVTLTVGNPQVISLTPSSLNFSFPAGSATVPPSQTLQLTSTGGNVPFTAAFTAVSGGSFVTVSPASGNTPGTITVAPSLSAISALNQGTYTGNITITSSSLPNGSQTVPVTLTVTAAGPPTITAVVNAANNQPGAVSPGELVTIYGTAIGPATGVGLQLTSNGMVSTNLGNTVVTFDGIPAPLTYVSANQINVIVPYEVNGRTTTNIVVQRATVNSTATNVRVTDTAPAIFTASQGAAGQGAILNANNTPNSSANPAAKGSAVAIFGTGEGQLIPGGVTGSVTANSGLTFPKPVGNVSVTVGGVPAAVQYAGSAPGLVAGVLQVNVVIPQSVASGNQPVVITVGNNSSSGNVTVAVQ